MGLSKQKCPFLCGWHSQGGYSGFQLTEMIEWGQNKPQNKFGCTLFTELLSRNTRPLPRILRLFWIPKESLLKSSHPKKILAEFSYPKNPGIENVKPKKSFDHPRHSKSGVPPGGHERYWCMSNLNSTTATTTTTNFIFILSHWNTEEING